jgi:hypothetical protein
MPHLSLFPEVFEQVVKNGTGDYQNQERNQSALNDFLAPLVAFAVSVKVTHTEIPRHDRQAAYLAG